MNPSTQARFGAPTMLQTCFNLRLKNKDMQYEVYSWSCATGFYELHQFFILNIQLLPNPLCGFSHLRGRACFSAQVQRQCWQKSAARVETVRDSVICHRSSGDFPMGWILRWAPLTLRRGTSGWRSQCCSWVSSDCVGEGEAT